MCVLGFRVSVSAFVFAFFSCFDLCPGFWLRFAGFFFTFSGRFGPGEKHLETRAHFGAHESFDRNPARRTQSKTHKHKTQTSARTPEGKEPKPRNDWVGQGPPALNMSGRVSSPQRGARRRRAYPKRGRAKTNDAVYRQMSVAPSRCLALGPRSSSPSSAPALTFPVSPSPH